MRFHIGPATQGLPAGLHQLLDPGGDVVATRIELRHRRPIPGRIRNLRHPPLRTGQQRRGRRVDPPVRSVPAPGAAWGGQRERPTPLIERDMPWTALIPRQIAQPQSEPRRVLVGQDRQPHRVPVALVQLASPSETKSTTWRPRKRSDTDQRRRLRRPRYDTCAEANYRESGPYVEGVDLEYDWYQDRDGDGIVCEPR